MAQSSEGEFSTSPPTSTSLNKWWRLFREKGNKANEMKQGSSKDGNFGHSTAVFGVALQTSLQYASVAISQVCTDGKARVYGHIPVIVAKTGLYLKENGTTTQGVFRVSGSNKRIKELELIFDSPPSYGKDLVWETYSVHDAASVFRRYLNMLPEPIIPFELYQTFQDALPRTMDGSPVTTAATEAAVVQFKALINSLPPASQHIFCYVLDLLGVFARKSDSNLMSVSNLATIFQPGLLRHPPTHPSAAAAAPTMASSSSSGSSSSPDDKNAARLQIESDAQEHKRSQEVLEFLIEHQSAFELELPPHIAARVAAKTRENASRRKTSQTSPTSSASSRPKPPALDLSQSARSMDGGSSADDEDWHKVSRRAVTGELHGRSSDQSEQRRKLRRKKAEARKQTESGTPGVKRSRTLPSQSGRSPRATPSSTPTTSTAAKSSASSTAGGLKPTQPIDIRPSSAAATSAGRRSPRLSLSVERETGSESGTSLPEDKRRFPFFSKPKTSDSSRKSIDAPRPSIDEGRR